MPSTTTGSAPLPVLDLDHETCYRAADSRDARFDGIFYLAVHTTGIYCRPSCPATMPKPGNLTFYPSAAAAQRAGFRACRRCRPDSTPGSPEWDFRADVVGRAMRLIADGVVEREGVTGLAARVGYSTRQLDRLMLERFGAGPLALARSRRAHTARILIEQTTMPFADVAFAAGFASVRQFNDTIRETYASTPRQLRAVAATANGSPGSADPGSLRVVVDLAVRRPFDAAALLTFLADRAVAGVETADRTCYRRTLALPGGPALVRLTPAADGRDQVRAGQVRAEFALTDLRDLSVAVERCRRLLDLDADPVAIAETLNRSERIGPLVRRRPGLRVPGHVDGFELAVRAIVGQQISVAGARTVLGRIAARYGAWNAPAGDPAADPTLVFPTAAALAAADPAELPMPRSRGHALVALAEAVASGLSLDRGADRAEVRRDLLALPGIGPWTADYIAMRALGDPDVWLGTDLGVRHALAALGPVPTDDIDRCRPWRSYAVMQLWHHADPRDPDPTRPVPPANSRRTS